MLPRDVIVDAKLYTLGTDRDRRKSCSVGIVSRETYVTRPHLTGNDKIIEIYSNVNEKLFEGYKQNSDITFAHSRYSV